MSNDSVRTWQSALLAAGYEVGQADGVFGPSTLRASLKALNGDVGGDNGSVSPGRALSNPKAFFDAVRRNFGGLDQKQVDGFNVLLKAMKAWPVDWVAYGLATVWHETARTMQPISEFGHGRGRKYGVPGRNNGQIPYGRGYVQLTWDDNYDLMDKELGLNGSLKANYELANDPDIAARILVRGMERGLFTGKGLKDYPGDYVNARRIINSTDKAQLIAGYAKSFEAALRAGGWS